MTDETGTPHRRRRAVPRRLRGGSPGAVATEIEPDATPPVVRYVDGGAAVDAPAGAGAAQACAFSDESPQRSAVVAYPDPTAEQIGELSRAWDLHPLLAEDLEHAGQRPKLETYGDTTFLVVRAAWYIDQTEDVELAELHLVVRHGVVAVLCQDGTWIDGEDAATASALHDRLLPEEEALLAEGPWAIVHRILDQIVDGYGPVLRGLATDQEQIERQVFSGDAAAAERIYRLSREVIDLKHATASMAEVVAAVRRGAGATALGEEVDTRMGDVADHLARADARVTELRDALAQILDVNATLVAHRQNEDMKKISGWAAILFSPSLIAAIYGMNFDVMPELHWTVGYPLALTLMAAFAVTLHRVFKRRRWL